MTNFFERAALSKDLVEIIYFSENQEITQRIIKVINFSNAEIKAYCYLRKCFRIFKVKNVLSALPVAEQDVSLFWLFNSKKNGFNSFFALPVNGQAHLI